MNQRPWVSRYLFILISSIILLVSSRKIWIYVFEEKMADISEANRKHWEYVFHPNSHFTTPFSSFFILESNLYSRIIKHNSSFGTHSAPLLTLNQHPRPRLRHKTMAKENDRLHQPTTRRQKRILRLPKCKPIYHYFIQTPRLRLRSRYHLRRSLTIHNPNPRPRHLHKHD